ncbi:MULTISPECIES: osmotically-inducible lipoprotein OsmB [Arsenophonus]|jgi:osmotically inducible lipoprotein OsmB|uniref:Osmotically-inducible lipoprotein OsmB n=2 Tax=Arsenophonus apicola TaxID=2879119 RepID=A0ABY8NYT4_9GAMM|nr:MULTISPECIES: osmotically-inducible lipoprotein OsmB [Arsenophonus]UBX27810.1 osmotically-inducible lipoprotein OsmB [Arsenophonus apicola]WGO82407.1 osmotically-inducible lipoprotein OsmB [Arsenophonus apicola]
MKRAKKHILLTLISVFSFLFMTACSNMSQRDKNTTIGAGIGAVGGAILTEGSGLGTVGGAAIGGLIGHQVGKK